MAAANTDLFKKGARKWVGQIGAGGVADDTVTTIPLASVTGLPTDTAIDVVIDRVDANGTAAPALEETVTGVVSGTNLVTCTRGVEGTAQAHAAGAVVEVLITANMWGDLIDGLLVEHNQLGYHTNIDGWVPANETWTYASATTITVPAGATSKYQKGDKIKLTQSGSVKYFYIITVASTLLTVTGGTDYTVANAAITGNYYSKANSPQGFPTWFNWTPTITGSGSMTIADESIIQSKFSVNGQTCFFSIYFTCTTGGTASTTLGATVPITGMTASGMVQRAPAVVRDGTFQAGMYSVGSGATSLSFMLEAGGNWGLGVNRTVMSNGFYLI